MAEAERTEPAGAAVLRRRNHVGTLSLLGAVAGSAVCRIGLVTGPFAGAGWLQLASAGFDAAMVGGLADWFAVTALFRHPLGLPIPHTAIIPRRRAKIIEGIVSMVEDQWLSPEVIGARLARIAPSELLVDWLRNPAHVERLGAPLRDLLRALARMLTAAEVVEFVERNLQRQLREVPLDAASGRWLATLVASDHTAATFSAAACSLANLTGRPETAASVRAAIDRSARQLRKDGKLLVPLFLRRRVVQRKLVEAACDYLSGELRAAAADPDHPWRRALLGAVHRFADRLASGDPTTLEQVERVRAAVVDSLEARPLVLNLLTQLRRQLDEELGAPRSHLSDLIDRQLRAGIVDLLEQSERRAAFDHWVRTTADDLLRRHHDQIGLTVRENLEALETDTLVAQIEDRVGADLQFIRLNGAVVGGLIGVLLALAHRLVG